ncbi:MAG: ribonuclease R, partial [Agathobacter sp.]|nr:ribonuclease R [Agathobacter sp.]
MEKLFEQRKKMIYEFMSDDMYVPMKIKELAIVLGVTKEQRPELEYILTALMSEGKIELTKRGKYKICEVKKYIGTFTSHPKGFGFVTIEGMDDDIFIPANGVHGALHMDIVEITIAPAPVEGKRKEGTVVRIVERGTNQLVCTYESSKNFGFAIPDNPRFGKDIFIPLERSKGAVKGHKVVVE